MTLFHGRIMMKKPQNHTKITKFERGMRLSVFHGRIMMKKPQNHTKITKFERGMRLSVKV